MGEEDKGRILNIDESNDFLQQLSRVFVTRKDFQEYAEDMKAGLEGISSSMVVQSEAVNKMVSSRATAESIHSDVELREFMQAVNTASPQQIDALAEMLFLLSNRGFRIRQSRMEIVAEAATAADKGENESEEAQEEGANA